MNFLAAFDVTGIPAPQGSKTRMPNGAVLEAASKTGRAKHKAWRKAVQHEAEQVRDDQPYDGPLAVTILFRFPMPQSRPAAVRKRGVGWHSVVPDKDKCQRSTLDALADAKLIVNDARVCRFDVNAIEVMGAHLGGPGASVVLHGLDDADLSTYSSNTAETDQLSEGGPGA